MLSELNNNNKYYSANKYIKLIRNLAHFIDAFIIFCFLLYALYGYIYNIYDLYSYNNYYSIFKFAFNCLTVHIMISNYYYKERATSYKFKELYYLLTKIHQNFKQIILLFKDDYIYLIKL